MKTIQLKKDSWYHKLAYHGGWDGTFSLCSYSFAVARGALYRLLAIVTVGLIIYSTAHAVIWAIAGIKHGFDVIPIEALGAVFAISIIGIAVLKKIGELVIRWVTHPRTKQQKGLWWKYAAFVGLTLFVAALIYLAMLVTDYTLHVKVVFPKLVAYTLIGVLWYAVVNTIILIISRVIGWKMLTNMLSLVKAGYKTVKEKTCYFIDLK